MNLKCVIFGAIFLAISAAFFTGTASNWISELRAMSEAEKQSINLGKLERNIAGVFLAAGVIFGAAGLSEVFLNTAFMWCMVAWFVLTGLDVVFISRSRPCGNSATRRFSK